MINMSESYCKIKCDDCGYYFLNTLNWICPKCRSRNIKVLRNRGYIEIFRTNKELNKIQRGKNAWLFPRGKRGLRWIKTKSQISFYNTDRIIICEIEFLKRINAYKSCIFINGIDCKTIILELTKINFSLGLDISEKREREVLTEYIKENFGLPFDGWYLKVKE